MIIRNATIEDLGSIISLISNDSLGARQDKHTDPLLECYVDAFKEIDQDKNSQFKVACNAAGHVIGTVQLTFIRHLTRRGMLHAKIAAMYVHQDHQGQGIGRMLCEYAIEEAKKRGCGMIELTSHNLRTDTHGFYEALGFDITHKGMSLLLDTQAII